MPAIGQQCETLLEAERSNVGLLALLVERPSAARRSSVRCLHIALSRTTFQQLQDAGELDVGHPQTSARRQDFNWLWGVQDTIVARLHGYRQRSTRAVSLAR